MVGYRMFVLQHAAGLNGTVANQPDGSVECVLEGPAGEVERLIGRLREGPSQAQVERVDVIHETYRGDLPPFTVTA